MGLAGGIGDQEHGRARRVLAMVVAASVVAGVVVFVSASSVQRMHETSALSGNSKHRPPVHQPRAQATAPGVPVAWARGGTVDVYREPSGSPEQSLSNPNSLGAPLVMLVHATRPNWDEVYLPERPNESLGWVRSAEVSVAQDDEHIVVELHERLVELFRGTKMVFDAPAAVGAPDSPTPTGFFYVTEVLRLTDPESAYGPYALGLSGFSGTYQTFEGGPGQIAIHGTDQPMSIGQYASHGCVRLSNPDITALATQVQAGTPVSVID